MLRKIAVALGIMVVLIFNGCSSKPSDPKEILEHYIENVIKKRDLRGAETYYADKDYAKQNLRGVKYNFDGDYYGKDIENLEYKIELKEQDKNRIKYNLRMRNKSHKEAYYRDWNFKETVIFERINGGWKISFFQ